MDKTKIYAEELTLRDYFAGQALAGLLARNDNRIESYIIRMADCYEIADAMMQEV